MFDSYKAFNNISVTNWCFNINSFLVAILLNKKIEKF